MKTTTAWCLYDVGHSAFATTMMAAVLPVYFSSVATQGLGPDPETSRTMASTLWAQMNTAAMILSAVAAPWLGALADRGGGRKKLLVAFAAIGISGCLAFSSVGAGDWRLAAWLYVVCRFAFASSLVFYDSILVEIARPGEIDRLSARGYAWGYFGGGVLLALQLLVIMRPGLVGLAEGELPVRLSFLSVGIWWALFTVPLIRNVAERPGHCDDRLNWTAVRAAWMQLVETLRHLRRYRDAMRFLVAFWFYNDGIGTIVVMAAAFGSELGLPRSTLLGAILLVQFLGLPFSLLFGRLAHRIGARSAILWGLFGYMGICIWGFFLDQAWEFWVLAIAVSVVQGGCQSLSRSLFARLIPVTHAAEFFGLYNVSSKFAGILGPLLFATVSASTGSARGAILALVTLFLLGALLLRTVDPARAERELSAG
jgi:MFS transporter, UMF1 family